MKICSPQLGLAPNSVLGGEVFDREVLLGLAGRGVEIETILPKYSKYDKFVKNLHTSFLPVAHFPPWLFNFLILPYMYKVTKMKGIKIIRIHQPQYIGVGGILIKIINHKIKLLATYHQFKESNFYFLSKLINNYWDHIICDSQAVANKVNKKYGVSPDKISVVHNGVPSYLKPKPKDKTLVKKLALNGKIILLYQGFFIERKNPLFLIEVLSELNNPNVCLVFWGKGPLRDKILEKAKAFGLARQVTIQDPVFGPEKNKVHNLADIFVHPSLDEGFALAPLESMACAKPVVMTKGYSAAEAVQEGINGFLCQAGDVRAWTGKLSKLINDSRLRDKMGQSSLTKVKEQFQWTLTTLKHLEVLKKLDQ